MSETTDRRCSSCEAPAVAYWHNAGPFGAGTFYGCAEHAPNDATPLQTVVHLLWGHGRSTVCGLSRAQAEAAYAPDAPVCPVCGPLGAAQAERERRDDAALVADGVCYPLSTVYFASCGTYSPADLYRAERARAERARSLTSFDVVCGRRTHTLTIDGTRGAVDLGELRLSQALEALTLLVAAAREAGADTLAVYTESTVYSLPLAVTEES